MVCTPISATHQNFQSPSIPASLFSYYQNEDSNPLSGINRSREFYVCRCVYTKINSRFNFYKIMLPFCRLCLLCIQPPSQRNPAGEWENRKPSTPWDKVFELKSDTRLSPGFPAIQYSPLTANSPPAVSEEGSGGKVAGAQTES